jgi:heme-degrading monooxygenase HmoA
VELAHTPEPPYYAVIFSSLRNVQPDDRYDETAKRMLELAATQPGYLGVDEAREGVGITVSYWTDEASIAAWKRNADHEFAQYEGRTRWYDEYQLRIAKVERAYRHTRDT